MDVKALNLNRFKENSPVKTVEKIRAILDANGIQVEEHWFPESSIGTCSLRVNIAGTLIGSNGKGINREYARASAYAEFIERLQNNKLTGNAVLSNIFRRKKSGPYMCANEEILDAYTLAEEKNTFVNSFLRSRNVDPEDTEAAAELLTVCRITARQRTEQYIFRILLQIFITEATECVQVIQSMRLLYRDCQR